MYVNLRLIEVIYMKLQSTQHQSPHARRSSVVEEVPGQSRYEYADAFEVTLRRGDDRTAEQMVRDGLEHAPPRLRATIVIVHRHVLRFRLRPVSSPNHVVGWRIVSSEPEVVHLETTGPLIAGTLVARRVDATTARLTTFVHYQRPLARVVWAVVGPLHRRVAPYLLARAAARPAESV
jgi:Protein of unknown function (DUF2867)